MSKLSQHGAFGTMVPAGLFIGIGVGLWAGQILAGVLIGFGFGLAAAYIVSQKFK